MHYIAISILLGILSIIVDSFYEKPAIESFELSVNYHLDGDSAIRDMDGLPEDLFEYRLEDDQIYKVDHEYTTNPFDCVQFEGFDAYQDGAQTQYYLNVPIWLNNVFGHQLHNVQMNHQIYN